MARKRSGEEDILRLVRGVEVHCNSGMDVVSACHTDSVSARPIWLASDVWGMNRARLAEMR